MKHNKPHTNAHANNNIEHKSSKSTLHYITKSKSYVENIDGQKPSIPKPKQSFALITHPPANNSHCKQTKRSERKNQPLPVRNQKCSYLFSVIVKDSIEQSCHTQCNNRLRKLRKHDNIRQTNLFQKLKQNDRKRHAQHIRLLNKIKKHDNLFDKLILINQACRNKPDIQFAQLMKQLYEEAGELIEAILHAFVNEHDSLPVLLEHENYSRLADILHSLKNEENVLFETFRQLLIESIEGTKKSDNRQGEQDTEYKKLLALYNTLRAENEQKPILSAEADMDTAAEILPEIQEYIRRGYKLVNEFGKLIPIDMDVLGEIRSDLGIE